MRDNRLKLHLIYVTLFVKQNIFDTSNEEQLSCALKYEKQKIREKLLEFRPLVLLRSYLSWQRRRGRTTRPGHPKDARPNILWYENMVEMVNGMADMMKANNTKTCVNSRVRNVFILKIRK